MIRFEKVTRRLGGRLVLDAVDLEIQKGETFVIVGSSGAGKSVTLKHMVRLLTPDSGRVWVGDDVVSEARGRDLERIRSRFGVLFQGAALLQWLNVGDNVALPLREHTNMSEEEIDRLVEEKLRLVNLEDVMDKFPANLSGGMRKRVGLARAIIRSPEIILYDEPTSGLDPVSTMRIEEMLRRLKAEYTIVLVTNNTKQAARVADRTAFFLDGELVEVGDTVKIFSVPSDPRTNDYILGRFG